VANIELPNHERGRVVEIIHVIIIENTRPTIIENTLEIKYRIIELIRIRNEYLK
jgi:hypothetical protein